MNEEELSKLAREYAEACGNGSVVIESRYDIMTEVLQFILRDHCIVKKSDVKREHVEALKRCKNQDHYDGACEVISNLFGTDLFKVTDEFASPSEERSEK